MSRKIRSTTRRLVTAGIAALAFASLAPPAAQAWDRGGCQPSTERTRVGLSAAQPDGALTAQLGELRRARTDRRNPGQGYGRAPGRWSGEVSTGVVLRETGGWYRDTEE